MSWSSSIASEIGGMFNDFSWRADDRQRALEEWGTWRVARESEGCVRRQPRNRETYNAYQRSYRAARPHARAGAVARVRRWREANREQARKLSRASEKRRRERAKTDPAFRENYLRIRRESRARTRERRAA